MAKNNHLHFTSYDEVAEWFDTHDMADYEDQLIPVDIDFDLKNTRNWIELEYEIATRVRQLAQQRHISTHILVNELLKEKLSTL